jgi:hypothetical protein
MRALITVIRGTKGLNVRPRCIGTAWSLPFGAILHSTFSFKAKNRKHVRTYGPRSDVCADMTSNVAIL